MAEIYPLPLLDDSTLTYLPRLKSTGYYLYWLLILFFVLILACLPFINVDISVKSSGIARPVNERTEMKSILTGIIDSVYYKDGETVKKGSAILKLKDKVTGSKRFFNQFEIDQRKLFIHDLKMVTDTNKHSLKTISLLKTPVYKEQLSKYLSQKTDQFANVKKIAREFEQDKFLFSNKVITNKEFFDVQIQQEKLTAGFQAFKQDQLTRWQEDLSKYDFELNQYQEAMKQVVSDASYYILYAPVSGVLQGINSRYTGGVVQANESICSISPEDNLVGECYVNTADIGQIKIGQPVHFQIDAFNYNYFGILTGTVISVDNDYLVVDNKPMFRVRCLFDSNPEKKNRPRAKIKKGYTFQARFTVGRRSLWHLLFNKANDWLNPTAPDHS